MPLTIPSKPPPPAPRSARTPLVRWIVAVAVGEATGFAVAVVVAIGALPLPDPWRYLTIVAGGAVEGATLGAAQLIGMGARRPDISRWLGATTLGAAVAWSIGMLPSTLPFSLTSALGVLLLSAGAVALLASIPLAQWLTIRRRVHTISWIPVNMGAWAVAILWTFTPSPFVDESTSIGTLIAIYAVAGLLMALTVAALTATTARRLFD
ncbi:hypothetical protein ACWGST_09880 [Agromyces sp. NPDC055520]